MSKQLVPIVIVALTVTLVAFFELFHLPRIYLFAILLGLLLASWSLPLLPFITAPIRFHKRHFIRRSVTHEAVHHGRDIIPDEFWDLATRTVGELNGFGFKLRGHFRTSHDATGSVA